MTAINETPNVTNVERDTDLTSVQKGSLIFNTDSDELQVKVSSGWISVLDSLNSSPEQNVYVSNDGNNTTGLGTISAPYETIEFALNQITDASQTKPYTIKIVTGQYFETNLLLKPYVNLDGGNSQVQVSGSIALDSSYTAGGNLRIYDFGTLDVIAGIALDFDTLNSPQSIIFMQNCRTFSNTNIEISGSTNFTYFISDDLIGFELTLNNVASILQNQILGNVTITKDNTFPSYGVQLKSSIVNGLLTVNQNSTGIESLVIDTANCLVDSDSNFTSANGTATLNWNSQGDRLASINLDGAGVLFTTDGLSSIPNLTNNAIYNLRNLSNGLLANYTPSNYTPSDDSINGHLVGIDSDLGDVGNIILQEVYNNSIADPTINQDNVNFTKILNTSGGAGFEFNTTTNAAVLGIIGTNSNQQIIEFFKNSLVSPALIGRICGRAAGSPGYFDMQWDATNVTPGTESCDFNYTCVSLGVIVQWLTYTGATNTVNILNNTSKTLDIAATLSDIILQNAYDAGNTIQLTSERNLTITDSLGDLVFDVVEDGANSSAVMYRKGVITDNSAAGPFFELNNSSIGQVGTELGTVSVSGLASDTSFRSFNAINHEVIDASPGNYSVSQFFNSYAGGVETKYMEFDGIGQIEFYKTFDMKGNGIVAAGNINSGGNISSLSVTTASINNLTPVGGLSTGTSNSAILTASTAEQSISSATFVGNRQSPANTFQVGDAFVAVLAGNFASANGDTLTLRLKGGTGSATILSEITVPLNSSSATFFELEINFVIRAIGSAGVADIVANYDFSYNQSSGGNFQGERKCEVNNTTFDTTILNELDVTAQFSSNSGNNSIETLLSTLGKTY